MKTLILLFLFALLSQNCRLQTTLQTPTLQMVSKTPQESHLVLQWSAHSENILGFVIEKKTDDGPWMIVAQPEAGEQSYIDTTVAGTITYYRIRSFRDRALSDYSNVTHSRATARR